MPCNDVNPEYYIWWYIVAFVNIVQQTCYPTLTWPTNSCTSRIPLLRRPGIRQSSLRSQGRYSIWWIPFAKLPGLSDGEYYAIVDQLMMLRSCLSAQSHETGPWEEAVLMRILQMKELVEEKAPTRKNKPQNSIRQQGWILIHTVSYPKQPPH